MAILFVTHKFPPGVGGMEKQSYELLSGMRSRCKIYTIIQAATESKVVFFFLLFFRLNRRIKAHPDITTIHCNDAVVASFCSFFLKRRSLIMTATFHGLDIVFPNVVFQKWIVPRLRRFDRIFTVSEATAQACLDRGFAPDQIRVIKNGVDHELADTQKDLLFTKKIWEAYGIDLNRHELLVSVGRAVKRKGFSWFVKRVMPALQGNVRYVVIGPTQNKQTLVRTLLPSSILRQWDLFMGRPSDSLDLEESMIKDKRCLLLGKLPYSELRQWMLHADLFIMPNQKVHGDMEGFGLVALESGLSGTYTIASGIEGITCAIEDQKNGTLISHNTSTRWTEVISEMLSDKIVLSNRGEQARAYVLEHFQWNTMVEQYSSAFLHLELREQGRSRVTSSLSINNSLLSHRAQ